ncbi:hypothetical protein QBC41DRAFT_298393 [Cercophora samala]|uniref:Uncharacterized protein n=1 Tax=Cercophora samala TaxID=330535 RepID=A0AA39ZMK6_9PEZI|nr:hypothetical protein QBC41DRAFT_298393 [Cercophora samala]
MIFTTPKTNGLRASVVKSMIGLALRAVPVVAGSNGVVARGDEAELNTLCTTSSIDLPAPSIVLSTTDDVDAISGAPIVTAISSTDSSCSAESVTVTVTVTTLNSDDPIQTAGPPLSGSVSSSDDSDSTITEIVTSTGTITETVATSVSSDDHFVGTVTEDNISSTGTITETAIESMSTDVETTTDSGHGYIPFISISSISEEPSTVTTILSTNTATKTLTDTLSLSANTTVYVSTTITVATVTVSDAAGTIGTTGTYVPYAGRGHGNSTFTYSAPSASAVYPSSSYLPASAGANNGGGRGAQVWYCIVMVVAVLGYTL